MTVPPETGILNHSFWGRGFRPFFFGGAIYAVLGILLWTGMYAGYNFLPEIFPDTVAWHAHEMIYGFTMAIVAGFLLTAVANWTGGAPVRQIQLITLFGLWVIGRLVLNVAGFPEWFMFVAELAFIPALAVSLALPLIKSLNTRNFVFLGILGALWLCDVFFMITQERMPLYIALVFVMVMISLIGGRIIPAFTVGALRRKGINVQIHDQNAMDIVSVASLVAVAVTLLVTGIESAIFSGACFVSSFIHLVRMRRYHTGRSFGDPMIWVLHAGYGWLVVGLFLAGLSAFGIWIFPAALHAITVGSIGSLTLGMMARVTLGHTGRDLSSNNLTTLSFLLMQIAAILRVFGPVLLPEHYTLWVVSSGIVWSLCFTLYFFVYAPMLWSPRPDRQPA